MIDISTKHRHIIRINKGGYFMARDVNQDVINAALAVLQKSPGKWIDLVTIGDKSGLTEYNTRSAMHTITKSQLIEKKQVGKGGIVQFRYIGQPIPLQDIPRTPHDLWRLALGFSVPAALSD
jgi:hypothetical protein